MPRVRAVCALLAILFLTMPVTEVYAAPSTGISDLQYPTRVVLGASKYTDGIPVTFQVHWTGARKNDLLLMGVLDDQTQDFVEGSTDIFGCLLSRGGIVFEKRGRAYCALPLPELPSFAYATFHLKLPPAGTRYFFAKATLADSYGRSRVGSVSTSQTFSVELVSSVTLTVKVPIGVTITLDGVAQRTGIVSVGVGPHTISIPDFVSVDNVTRLRFDHWTDGYTSSNRLVTLEDDAQFEAVYVRQFLLTATSPYGNATGTGWYDEGTTVTVSVVTPQTMSGLYGLLGGKYVFSHWSGGSAANTPTASVKMDGPKTVTAVWSIDYGTPIIASTAIIIFALMPLLYVFRKRKAAPTPALQQPVPPSAERVTQPSPEIVRGETLEPPKCRVCGQSMKLLDEEKQRWYCYKDDEVYYAKQHLWGEYEAVVPIVQKPPAPAVGELHVWVPILWLVGMFFLGFLFSWVGGLVGLIGATIYVHYDAKKYGVESHAVLTLLFAIIGLPLYANELHKLRRAQQTGQVRTLVEPTTPATTPSFAQQASATSPLTKFCRECGARIPRDSVFCEECGAKLT